MKKKHLIAASAVMAAIAVAAPSTFAAEEVVPDAAIEMTEAESEAAVETEADLMDVDEVTEEESESEAPEDDALLNQHLSDVGYEPGVLEEDGWESTFLNMAFIPGNGVVMGVEENKVLQEYHNRNGEENAVAASEVVAYTDDQKSYVQLMVEVNPNAESDEDILKALAANESLKDTTELRTVEIGGKNFISTTGTVGEDHYFLAVTTDQDGVAVAIKLKYVNAMKKRILTSGFEALAEDPSAVEEGMDAEISDQTADEEVVTDADIVDQLDMPAEMEEASTEVQTETEM